MQGCPGTRKDAADKPESAVPERAEDQRFALLEGKSCHVPNDAAVRDEHRDPAGPGLRPQQPARCADLTPPRRVVVGSDGIQKRRADGRAAERESCRLAGAAERTREHGPDPELQSLRALPDATRVAATVCREVPLRAAILQIDRILVGLREVRRCVPDDEDHVTASQLIAEPRVRSLAGRERQSSSYGDDSKSARPSRDHLVEEHASHTLRFIHEQVPGQAA